MTKRQNIIAAVLGNPSAALIAMVIGLYSTRKIKTVGLNPQGYLCYLDPLSDRGLVHLIQPAHAAIWAVMMATYRNTDSSHKPFFAQETKQQNLTWGFAESYEMLMHQWLSELHDSQVSTRKRHPSIKSYELKQDLHDFLLAMNNVCEGKIGNLLNLYPNLPNDTSKMWSEVWSECEEDTIANYIETKKDSAKKAGWKNLVLTHAEDSESITPMCQEYAFNPEYLIVLAGEQLWEVLQDHEEWKKPSINLFAEAMRQEIDNLTECPYLRAMFEHFNWCDASGRLINSCYAGIIY